MWTNSGMRVLFNMSLGLRYTTMDLEMVVDGEGEGHVGLC
jgi:hypothetical protein